MPLSLEDFLDRLRRSRLIRDAKLQAFRESLERPAETAEDLARQLVGSQLLTEYQAKQVYRGNTDLLMIGDYQIMEQIGFGGMGQVFKAWHAPMARAVALKLLPEESFDSPQAIRRFRREVQASARLDHLNIVSAQTAGEVDGRQYFVMQFIEGGNLAERIASSGPLSLGAAIDCILQAARGLQHAHERGVIHRDIKPGNLLLGDDGVLRILDLGLARFLPGSEPAKMAGDSASDCTRLTLPGQMLGTVEFAPPEQAQDTRGADERSDIYSLGCTLYYLLVGAAPFTGEGIVSVLIAHASAPIPSVCEQRDDAPAELDAILAKMTAKNPDDRYQSVSELISILTPISERATNTPASFKPSHAANHKTVVAGESKTPSATSAPDTVAGESDDLSGDNHVVAIVSAAPTVAVSLELAVARWALEIGGRIAHERDGAIHQTSSSEGLAHPPLQLDSVDLNSNSAVVDADLQRLKQLKRLRGLDLSSTKITDSGMRHLRGLRSLEQLNLNGTEITDMGLAYLVTLQNLQELNLGDTGIGDQTLKMLAQLRSLRRLVLTNTQASDDGVKRLQSELTECLIVR